MTQRFSGNRFLIRKKVLKLFGGAFHVFDEGGSLAFYSDLKAFKLREDIRLYTDETKQEEVLTIKARSILDFSAAYDVTDPSSGEKVGVLKRKGLKSLLKDEWVIMNAQDQEVGLIQEDNVFFALIRRFVCNLIPQNYHASVQGQAVCHYLQNFNPFVTKITVDFSQNTEHLLDNRLGLAAGILLCAIEGKQD